MIRADLNLAGGEPLLDLNGTDTGCGESKGQLQGRWHDGGPRTYIVPGLWPRAKSCK